MTLLRQVAVFTTLGSPLTDELAKGLFHPRRLGGGCMLAERGARF
jgi:hypothetical protein